MGRTLRKASRGTRRAQRRSHGLDGSHQTQAAACHANASSSDSRSSRDDSEPGNDAATKRVPGASSQPGRSIHTGERHSANFSEGKDARGCDARRFTVPGNQPHCSFDTGEKYSSVVSESEDDNCRDARRLTGAGKTGSAITAATGERMKVV